MVLSMQAAKTWYEALLVSLWEKKQMAHSRTNLYGLHDDIIQIQIDTDIAQHTPYQGFSVTGYIVNI
jgi:hypothetical protein